VERCQSLRLLGSQGRDRKAADHDVARVQIAIYKM